MIKNEAKQDSICSKFVHSLNAAKPKTQSDYFFLSWIVPASLAGAAFFGPVGGVFGAIGASIGYFNSLDPAPQAIAKKVDTAAKNELLSSKPGSETREPSTQIDRKPSTLAVKTPKANQQTRSRSSTQAAESTPLPQAISHSSSNTAAAISPEQIPQLNNSGSLDLSSASRPAAASQPQSASCDDKKFPETRSSKIEVQQNIRLLSARDTPKAPNVRIATEKESSLVFPSQTALFAEARPVPQRGNTCWAASITQTILPFLENPLIEKIKNLERQLIKLESETNKKLEEIRVVKDDLQTCRKLLKYIEDGKKPGDRQVHQLIEVFYEIASEFRKSYVRRKNSLAKLTISDSLTKLLKKNDSTELNPLAADVSRAIDNLSKLDVKNSKFESFKQIADNFNIKLWNPGLEQQDADEMVSALLLFVEGESQIQECGFGYYFDDQNQPVDRSLASSPYIGKRDISLIADKDNRVNPDISFEFLFQDSFMSGGIKDFNIGGGKKKDLIAKRDALSSPPQRLNILFKRYVYDEYGEFNRIMGPIPGMNEILEVPKDYFLNGENPQYRLDSAIIHIGDTPRSGHYVAIRRRVHAGSEKVSYELLNDGQVLDLEKATSEDLQSIVLSEKIPPLKTPLDKYLFLASYSYIPFYNRIG